MAPESAWETDEATVLCLGCGERMAPRRGLAVCSGRCAKREWRARRRRDRQAFCAVCYGAFSGRSDAKYCSGACRQRGYRRRLEARAAAEAARAAAARKSADFIASLIG